MHLESSMSTTILSVLFIFVVVDILIYRKQYGKESNNILYTLDKQTTKQPKLSEAKQKQISTPVSITDNEAKNKRVDPHAVCNATFGRTLAENIAKIESYKLFPAEKFFKYIDSPGQLYSSVVKQPGFSTGELPIIVTAASSNHYLESLEMLFSLDKVVRPTYPSIPVYYYDLGLEPHQKTEVKNICNCTVLDFPFDKFPNHVRRLKAYCWKPLIIKMMLQISQFVMWMDASIHFKTAQLDELFMQAKQYGVLMYHNVWSLPAHVNRDTFTFLGEPPCLYKNFTEYQAGLILVHINDSVVKNFIIDPWAKCAIIEDCMKTKYNEMDIIKCPSHTKFHACHRFDQAVLSILTYRLFHSSYRNHNIDMGKYFKICYRQSCRKPVSSHNKGHVNKVKSKSLTRNVTTIPSKTKENKNILLAKNLP